MSFREPEQYYLRLLLLHVKGVISFEDLRTVGGVTYDTFHEVANTENYSMTLSEKILLTMQSALTCPNSYGNFLHIYACVDVFLMHPDYGMRINLILLKIFVGNGTKEKLPV